MDTIATDKVGLLRRTIVCVEGCKHFERHSACRCSSTLLPSGCVGLGFILQQIKNPSYHAALDLGIDVYAFKKTSALHLDR
jgi:hypothetical protein